MANHFIRGGDPEAPHLFPARRFGAYSMSVQADRNGYGCAPRERIDDVRGYDAVEVVLYGPKGTLEAQRAGLSPEVRRLFPREGGAIAYDVPQAALPLIEDELRRLDAGHAPRPPASEAKGSVTLGDAGLREVLLKLSEAVRDRTGEENGDFVDAVAVLMEEARGRGIDLDGTADLEALAPSGPRP